MKLCEKCGQHPATHFWEESVGGKTSTLALCSHCAAESALGGDLFSFPLFGVSRGSEEACPLCGTTEGMIRKSGRFGCSACYDTFASRFDLTPYLGGAYQEKKQAPSAPVEEDLSALKRALQEAVKQEDYERAALLRDKIREKEGAK